MVTMVLDPERPELGWRPAVPVSYRSFGFRRCHCKRKFLRESRYQEHWRGAHGWFLIPRQPRPSRNPHR